jgi:hypothetical protein
MHQEHSQAELTLQFTQIGEQSGDLGGIVFIDAMESDQRIEDQQNRLQVLDGLGQALAVRRCIQPQRGRGDDFDGKVLEIDLSRNGDAFQPLTHHGQGVFGGEEQHFARASHGELPQASGARSDTGGDVQS